VKQRPAVLILLCALATIHAQQERQGKGGAKRGGAPETFVTDVPAHLYDVTLSQPSSNAVTATVAAYEPSKLRVRSEAAVYSARAYTAALASTDRFGCGSRKHVSIGISTPTCEKGTTKSPLYHFRTARKPSESYTVTIPGGFPPRQQYFPKVYERVTPAHGRR
jgi:hypothetical protein